MPLPPSLQVHEGLAGAGDVEGGGAEDEEGGGWDLAAGNGDISATNQLPVWLELLKVGPA